MNKYLVTIPYDYVQYGQLRCYVFADNSDDAYDLAMDSQNRLDEDYEDGDGDGTNYDYDEMRIEIDEEDVTLPAPRIFHQTNISHCVNSFHGLPEYFLAELQLV